MKIVSQGDEAQVARDKLPKKENEMGYDGSDVKLDADFEKYGYYTPVKVRSGHVTLRQFDEFLAAYKQSKSADLITKFSAESKLTKTDVLLLLEYYKPFFKIEVSNKGQTGAKLPIDSSLKEIIPSLK